MKGKAKPTASRGRLLRHARSKTSPLAARVSFSALALALAASASGCTNNILKTATGLIQDGIDQSNPNTADGGDGVNVSGLTLTRVQKNNLNPTATLDLIGDGTGAMGNLCQPLSGDTSGKTTCTCTYSYITAGGAQVGPVEVDTTYRERDQIRCSYATIPADVSTVTIRVRMTNIDAVSNAVTFRFTGTGVTLDLANRESFSYVQRYQCRDLIKVPYLWDSSVYDPFLSEDSRYTYPLNFYTTNMGKTMALYAADSTASKKWYCPPMPNDSSAGMDLSLFSVANDQQGSKSIFPPSGAFDRSTFFVAKAKSGAFSVPVNAYVYPDKHTTTQADPVAGQPAAAVGVPPIGYAARPTAVSGGGEACPDTSTVIPAGFQWAKLWLFRKQLPRRTYPTSARLAALGEIACNSRPWNPAYGAVPAAPNNTAFTDCSGGHHIDNLAASPNGMAARFFRGTAMCAHPGPGGTTNPLSLLQYDNTAGNTHASGVDFSPFAKGTDTYDPVSGSPIYGCGGSGVIDPARVCNNGTGHVAYDNTLPTATGPIDSTTDANTRFDYLFVVTPTSVNRADMDPSSSSTIHQTYTPVRFMSPNDCKSPNPDSPLTPGDCSPSRMLRYELKKHEIGSPGNPGEDDLNRAGDFPLCVLQPVS